MPQDFSFATPLISFIQFSSCYLSYFSQFYGNKKQKTYFFFISSSSLHFSINRKIRESLLSNHIITNQNQIKSKTATKTPRII